MTNSTPQSQLLVLMFTDLVNSSALKVELGDSDYVQYVARPHNAIFRQILARFKGAKENNFTGDGFLAIFERVSDAVEAALLFHHALATVHWERIVPATRIGIHLGESVIYEGTDEKQQLLASHAADMCARIMDLGDGGQTLLTRAAFDNARQYVRCHPAVDGMEAPPELKWMAHGRYRFKGKDEPMEVFEVGAVDRAPLRAPGDSSKARRAVSAEEEQMLGWRPASGLEVPARPGWHVDEKLGEGGFGEAWLARHQRTKQMCVFKFCYDAERLRSFKRELTLFRLIQEGLGQRQDIAEMREVRLDKPPFFLESEYISGGDLAQWSARQGGVTEVSLVTRIDIMARIARAVAAAHSLGVIHKDLKPSNIFMRDQPDGPPTPVLADFGIGAIADRSLLARHGVTDTGFTETLMGNESSRTGTRMYAPPESLLGKTGTTLWDIYALGVMLYQMAVGNLSSPLATGWEDEVEDVLLRSDIRACVEGDPARRLNNAADLAERLETLPRRHEEENQRLAAERRAAQTARRLKTLKIGLAITALFLAMAGSLSVLSFVQWQRAEQNARAAELARAAAEESKQDAIAGFQAARSSVDTFLTTASQTFKFFPSAQKPLLEAAAATYEQFTKNKNESPELKLEEGRAHLRLGDVYADLQNKQQALAEYQAGRAVFEKLVDGPDRDPAIPHELANSYLRSGLLEATQENYQAASDNYKTALAALDQLAQSDKPDERVLRDFAICQLNLAELQSHWAKPDAESCARRALKQLEKLLEAAPPQKSYRRYWCRANNVLGLVLQRQGDYGEALNHFTQALSSQQQLREATPNTPEAIEATASTFLLLVEPERKLGEIAQALNLIEKASLDYANLSGSYHEYLPFQEGLTIARLRMGGLLASLGDFTAAETEIKEALSLATTIAGQRPENLKLLKLQAASAAALGEVLSVRDVNDQAANTLRFASIGLEKILEAQPQQPQVRLLNAVAQSKLGELFHKTNRYSAAESSFQAAVATLAALADELPGWPEYHLALADAVESYGHLLIDLQRTDEADVTLTKVLNELEAVYQDAPCPQHARRLSWFLANCLRSEFRDPSRAVSLAQEATEGAAEDADCWNALGAANYRAGNWQVAVDALTKAVERRSYGENRRIENCLDDLFLAMAFWKLDETEKAREHLTQARERMLAQRPGDLKIQGVFREAEKLIPSADPPADPQSPK